MDTLRSKFVIAGGGMVAGYAAKKLVELGVKEGELAILSADNSLPYERPPLSKGFLAGRDTEDAILINGKDFYGNRGIDVRLNCEITAVDPGAKHLTLKSGDTFGFEKLLLASGARSRRLKTPGAGLEGIRYLRSMDDSKAIGKLAKASKQAVVLGGGFIGMEVASVIAQGGSEVTMILPEDRVWQRLFSPEISQFFESYYTARGVRLIKSAMAAEFRGSSRVESTVLQDGRSIPCDLVVAGIGAEPVTEYLAGSGIETGNGVIVNEYLETNQANIFAAGDIANYPDELFGKRRRVEHWDNAVSQGEHCARALVGERAPFRHVPYFFSDVFDLSYEFWGDGDGAGEVVHRGDLSSNSFSAWWLKDKTVVAAFVMNRPDEERNAASSWIESRQAVSAARLADAGRPITEALN